MTSCLKPPILLNGCKHHLGFVRRMINEYYENEAVLAKEVSIILKSVGSSQQANTVVNCLLLTVNFILQTQDWRLWTADCRLWTADCGLPTVD